MDKNLYILAELDDETQKTMEIYDKILLENGFTGKQTKDIPYHITLASYSMENENYLNELLDIIGKKYKQINISYSGFGLFGLNVLFLNPLMNLRLIELYNDIKEKSHSKDKDLSAHTTIYMDEPDNILKMLPNFVENSKPINGKIEYISLYEFFPKRLIKRINLKEE